MKRKIIAVAVFTVAASAAATLPIAARAQQQVELLQTGVDWVDKLGAWVQSIINMGADSIAAHSAPVTPNTPTTTQESLTQVLKAMTDFSAKITPKQATPPPTGTTN